jgi:hypothetical protein
MNNEVPLYFFNQTNVSEVAAIIGLAFLCVSLIVAPLGFKGWGWGVLAGICLLIPDAIWVFYEEKGPLVNVSDVAVHALLVRAAWLGPVVLWLMGGFAVIKGIQSLSE